jgi:hypothetical protein
MFRNLLLALCLLVGLAGQAGAACSYLGAYPWQPGGCLKSADLNAVVGNPRVIVANEAATGTVLNKLAKLTGAPSTAKITATTDTDGAVGVVISGAGMTGNAQIAVAGNMLCVFDGATTAGNWVGYSTTVTGDCKDVGSSRPAHGIGRVLSTNGAAGTYLVLLAPF